MTTETTTHTPGPWAACDLGGRYPDPIMIVSDPTSDNSPVVAAVELRDGMSHEEQQANAEYIVRACNSHHALLAACEEVSEAGRTANVMQMARAIATARAAIRAAKGGE